MTTLNSYFKSIDVDISEDAIYKLSLYIEEVLTVGKKMNLTSDLDRETFITKHVIDSSHANKYIDFKKIGLAVDIGTGAGLPGVVLACLNPATNFTLLDSLHKRINFLSDISRSVGIGNINPVALRAEDFSRDEANREQFDAAFSRAVASLNVLLEYAVPMLKVGGHFYAYKSKKCEEELISAQNAMDLLKVECVDRYEYRLPHGEYRVILDFLKKGATDEKYPRRNGKPAKRPL